MTPPAVTARRRTAARVRWAVGALCCVAAFVALYLLAVRTSAGQTVDIWIFAGAQGGPGPTEQVASVLRPGIPVLLGLVCAVLAMVALRRRRVGDVVAAVAVVVISLPLSQILQAVLDRPYLGDNGYLQNTLPSGHVAVAAAFAAAMVLLAPRAARLPLALVAAAAVAGACWASVVGHAHRPSDVVASVLLVGAVLCAVEAVVRSPSRVVAA